jgi:P4 family phage/plasmid primase-like protien
MKNCQPEIVKHLMIQFGFKCESIVEYCRDPKKYQHYFTKQDFITVLNGGFNPHPFLRSIQAEIEPFRKAIREQNPHIHVPEETDNSFFSYYLQSIERFLQESAVKEFVEKYHIPLREIIPCQDGFMIRKQYYKEGMLPTITNNWVIKPMNEAYEWHTTSVPYLPFDFGIYGHAEFAKLLVHVCKFDNILSTGQDKFLDAYQWDVYWRPLPLHNATFQQDSFEQLRNWCRNKMCLFRRATYACLEEVPEGKAVQGRKQEFLKTQALLEKQYIARRKTFEKEQATAFNEFTKRKKAYEKTEKEPYPKKFEKTEFTELFVKAEWTECELEDKVAKNNRIAQYCQRLEEQEKKLKNLSMLKERDSIIQILLRQAYRSHVEWNKNPYLFAFENCIFDIQTKQKVTPTQDQYINQSCGYEYDSEYPVSRIEEIKVLIESILPIENVRNFFLAKQSTMLTQNHPQYLFIQTGTGSNGKSILTDLTSTTLGNYGYKLPSTFLQKQFKEGADPVVAKLRNKRGVWCSEPKADSRLCASTIKELTGDKSINGRDLYQSDCDISLVFTLSLDANDVPNIDLVEYAMDRRLRIIPFTTTAISEAEYDAKEDKTGFVIINSDYVEPWWMEQYKQALFEILMEQYDRHFNFNNVPQECTDRKMKYLNASSDIYGFVSELYEPCDPETCTPIKLKDIYEEFKSSTVFKAFTKQQQRELNYSKFADKIRDEPAFKKLIKKREQYHMGKQLKMDCLIGFKHEEAMDGI